MEGKSLFRKLVKQERKKDKSIRSRANKCVLGPES